MSKYNATVTYVEGLRFDSLKEARRYQELRLLERAGEITDLVRQVRYPLVVAGVKVAEYRADFEYREGGVLVTEDVKSEATRKIPAYRIKRKLMKALYGIDIRET